MQDMEKLPEDLTPVNLRAYFANALGACGCSELGPMRDAIIRLLEWHEGDKDRVGAHSSMYPDIGVFYIMAGLMDRLGLAEHGISIRCPWLTADGKRLLAALKAVTVEDIDSASGEAHDGCTYGVD